MHNQKFAHKQNVINLLPRPHNERNTRCFIYQNIKIRASISVIYKKLDWNVLFTLLFTLEGFPHLLIWFSSGVLLLNIYFIFLSLSHIVLLVTNWKHRLLRSRRPFPWEWTAKCLNCEKGDCWLYWVKNFVNHG